MIINNCIQIQTIIRSKITIYNMYNYSKNVYTMEIRFFKSESYQNY